jgi:type II secretory pathway component PulF
MLATYMIPFVSKGLSTIDIFLHMQECESLWMKYIASKIHELLLEGHSYQNVYRLMNCFDNDWQQCVQRGIALANLEAMIQFYLDLAQKKLINAMRKLTIVIQVSAYLFIAMLVLFVFQIMLLPLSILETI